jgi:hypothetical protein
MPIDNQRFDIDPAALHSERRQAMSAPLLTCKLVLVCALLGLER